MDSMLIWIVMFAGAAIALLAVFLVASEKELKKKRLEIDQLLTRLGDPQTVPNLPVSSDAAPEFLNQEIDQLRSRNQELEKQLAAAPSDPQPDANTHAELELAQRNLEIAQSNAQWLQTNNNELKAQVEELSSRLEARDGSTGDSPSGTQDNTQRQQQLEAEIAELRAQLAESRSQARGIDSMQDKLANIDTMESNYREEKNRLEARTVELAKELSAANAARASEVESLRQQLAESNRLQQLLRDERRSLEQEMTHWQARVSQAEEKSRQLSALKEPFDDLLAKQAALEERQHEYAEAMAGFSRLITTANDSPPQTGGFNEFYAAPTVLETNREQTTNDRDGSDKPGASPAQIVAAAQTGEKPKRRFGMFPIVLVLALGGAMTAFWSMQGSDTTTTANAIPVASQHKAPDPPAPVAVPEPAVSEPPAPPEASAAKEVTAPAVKPKPQPARAIEIAKTQRAITGTYEITQSSRVYAAPSELSQLMGDIEPGVRVTVVNAKDGWLEIHSKHGRPPGFIRKESARVLARN